MKRCRSTGPDKVVRDFRKRIIVDANNPILAFKASRDRYTNLPNQAKYAGFPHLGSVNSEDALTWNVFRGLQKAQRLDIAADWLQVDIGKPVAMLIWCLAPEPAGAAGELQFQLGDLLRNTDGMIPGQISEPDVVIQGTEGIAVIECKLGETDKAPAHLWEGSSLQRVKQRLERYQQDIPGLIKEGKTEADVLPVYQMVRMAYYATRLGQIYQLRPSVVSVENGWNWNRKVRRWKKSADELWDDFCGLLGSVKLYHASTTWSRLPEVIANKGVDSFCRRIIEDKRLVPLYRYLEQHPCLVRSHYIEARVMDTLT